MEYIIQRELDSDQKDPVNNKQSLIDMIGAKLEKAENSGFSKMA